MFALDPIPANTTVAGFGGHVVDGRELEALGEAVRIHALQIDDDLFLASTPPFDSADYVNHSCDPNCGIVGSVLLVTMRDVEAGEELCFDYAMTDSDDYDMFTCGCGTERCRGGHHRRRLEAPRPARPLRRLVLHVPRPPPVVARPPRQGVQSAHRPTRSRRWCSVRKPTCRAASSIAIATERSTAGVAGRSSTRPQFEHTRWWW